LRVENEWSSKFVETGKQNFMLGIKDKGFVITGASSGIGEAT